MKTTIRVNRKRPESMTKQITDQLTGLIESGAMTVGSYLPSERELANSLKVARNVVRGSYENLMKAGRVQSEGRKGRTIRSAGGKKRAALLRVLQRGFQSAQEIVAERAKRLATLPLLPQIYPVLISWLRIMASLPRERISLRIALRSASNRTKNLRLTRKNASARKPPKKLSIPSKNRIAT